MPSSSSSSSLVPAFSWAVAVAPLSNRVRPLSPASVSEKSWLSSSSSEEGIWSSWAGPKSGDASASAEKAPIPQVSLQWSLYGGIELRYLSAWCDRDVVVVIARANTNFKTSLTRNAPRRRPACRLAPCHFVNYGFDDSMVYLICLLFQQEYVTHVEQDFETTSNHVSFREGY